LQHRGGIFITKIFERFTCSCPTGGDILIGSPVKSNGPSAARNITAIINPVMSDGMIVTITVKVTLYNGYVVIYIQGATGCFRSGTGTVIS